MGSDDIKFSAMVIEAQYFEDMTLHDDVGEELNDVLDDYGCPVHPSIERVEFVVSDLQEGVCASFDPNGPTITVSRDYSSDIGTLLHEMIHYYDLELEKLPNVRDVLQISLYEKLRDRVPDLIHRVASDMELVKRNEIEAEGGAHGVLFLLKSYDLDLRINRPLGTVHGYL